MDHNSMSFFRLWNVAEISPLKRQSKLTVSDNCLPHTSLVYDTAYIVSLYVRIYLDLGSRATVTTILF